MYTQTVLIINNPEEICSCCVLSDR